ncbi:MAG: 3-hydroxyacyl-CoA dehydrogenase family protein [Bacillota bacterium]
MELADIRKIGVVGAGTMGHGIALSFALGGYTVILNDLNNDILQKAMRNIRAALDTFVEEEIVTPQEAAEAVTRITTTTELELLARDVDYVCEAITESSPVKKELFNKLDLLCPPHTILASNTSSLVLSDFGSEVKRQDKIVVTHYFNPPHIVPTVEVVKGPLTSDETFNVVYDLLAKVKKLPVKVLKELPGYLVNRMQFALWREVFYLLCNGVASAEDIDRAVKGSFGFRLASIGPLLTMDFAGVFRWGQAGVDMLESAYRFICSDKEMPKEIKEKILAGKTIFDYPQEKWDELTRKRDKEFLQRLKLLYW